MSNLVSSYGIPNGPPQQGFGGRLTAARELPLSRQFGSYDLAGSASIVRMTSLPRGWSFALSVTDQPTFKNSAQLKCPGGRDYRAFSGDLLFARSEGGGVWSIYPIGDPSDAKYEATLGRNVWINGNADIWQKGSAMAAPAAVGGYQCDFWGHRGSGSTVFVERKDFPLGQTDVPGNPRYYYRQTVSSVAGAANYALMAADIDDVRTFANSKATLTFYAKADAAKSMTVAHDQFFGSGGSPSSPWYGTSTTVNLTTSWQRFDIRLDDWPSISGKTLGTSDTETDRIGIVFYFDAGSNHATISNSLGQQSGVFDIARISVREDPLDVARLMADPFPSDYSLESEMVKCQSLLRIIPKDMAIWSGYVENAGSRWLGIPIQPPLRRTPVVTVSNVSQNGFSGGVTALVASKNGVQLRGVGSSTINSGFYQCDVTVDANHPYTP